MGRCVKWFKEINSEEMDISRQREKSLSWTSAEKQNNPQWVVVSAASAVAEKEET